MTSDIARALDAALRTADDSDFLRQLSEIDSRFTSLEIEERPTPLDMFCTLWVLHLDVTMDGIWKFLGQDEGKAFHEARLWCDEIGAAGAVAYLDAVRKLFPRGKVPKDPEKRYAVVEKLEERAQETGDADPLQALDQEHAGAMPELARRMREWVGANRSALEQRLGSLPDPEGVPADEQIAKARTVLAGFEQMAAAAEKSHKERVRALRTAADKTGLTPGRGGADEKRLAHFIESASKLTQGQWTTVAQRYHKSKKKVEDAFMRGFALSQQLRSGQLGEGKAYAQRHEKLNKATQPLFQLTRELPKQVTVDGKKIGLLVGAHRAVAAAAIAVRLHDWFMLTPEDAERARAAYAPFAGLAWTPDQKE